MEIRKNWFEYFSLTIFGMGIGYILFCGILSISDSVKYPFLAYGGSFFIMGALWLVAHGFFGAAARFKLSRFFPEKKSYGLILEGMFLLVLLTAGGIVRAWAISYFPVEPASDYQTYYQIADLLIQGNLIRDGVGLCDYVSQFPHVFGYAYILSVLFKAVGVSVTAGLYLNMVMSLISIIFTYGIGRMLYGRAGGMISSALVAFWPSQILYGSLLAAEPVFTCLMLFSIGISVYLFKYPIETARPSTCLWLNVLLGVSLALASAVRPMSIILLISVIICILPCRVRINKDKNDVELLRRGMCKGWIRGLVIAGCYLLCSSIISGAVANAVDRELPGGSVSFGYNLLVGLNIEGKGSWNENDKKLFTDKFNITGSSVEAHKVCRDEAIKRFQENPTAIGNLAMEKFAFLWKNDDYASDWNIFFLKQQNGLTPAREEVINRIVLWNNIYYLFCVFFSLMVLPFFWCRKNGNAAQMLILLFIGTFIVHMVLENQNRYHYNILPVFAILTAAGMMEIYHHYVSKMKVTTEQELSIPEEPPVTAPREEVPLEHKGFDMQNAIEKGHVIITVSEAYGKKEDNTNQPEQKKDEKDGKSLYNKDEKSK